MKLYDKLIMLRKERGWSQEDFAEKLDDSRQAISRWENGTALPDAQNILQISKLFGVSADYLLNDDLEEDVVVSALEADDEVDMTSIRKKKKGHWYWISAICGIILLWACSIILIFVFGTTSEIHVHPEFRRVRENEISPTCTGEGSYDEVFYCTECGEEVYRTHVIDGAPAHQFENEKCIVCGEDQKAKQ